MQLATIGMARSTAHAAFLRLIQQILKPRYVNFNKYIEFSCIGSATGSGLIGIPADSPAAIVNDNGARGRKNRSPFSISAAAHELRLKTR